MNIQLHERDSSSLMNIKLYIIVVFLIITLPTDICNSEGSPFGTPINADGALLFCNYSVNYTQGSAFEINLITVLNTLVQDTSHTWFSTSVYGQSPDKIYGLLQCRGDTTVDQCYNCSEKAYTIIGQSHCGNAVGGRIWLDFCYLHYENFSFIGQLDTSGWYLSNTQTVSYPDAFNAVLQDLLANLTAEAANEFSGNRYASGTTNDSFVPKIYAQVQCTRDIYPYDCTTCFNIATTYMKENYKGRIGGQYLMGSCIVTYEPYSFFTPPTPAEAPAIFNSPSPAEAPANTTVVTSSSNGTHSIKIPIILGVVGSGLLLALLICLFTTRRRWKSAIFRRAHEVHEQVEEDTLVIEDRQIVNFKMKTLVAATENFHDNNKLGEGGFGRVYKGTHDGKEIAVKKLSLNSVQGKNEFLNEVKLVAKIQHRNLVKLLGCCAEGSEKLLVYEYLPNNSLDKILFDPIKRKQLDWQKRYNIILGVARGLLYLHQDSQPRIIHRDIKASNILLDDKLNPKIADFGIAKLFPEDESHVSTRVAGTYGYMAPEYAMQGQLTVKADVYSFGVLLLELVTGRKNTDYNLSPEMQILLGWAWRSYEIGNIVQMIDPLALIERCSEEQALRCIQVGLLCTQAEASLRTPMSTATLMLSSHSATLPNPTKPAFVSSTNQNTSSSSSVSGLSHLNETTLSLPPPFTAHATVTEFVPR